MLTGSFDVAEGQTVLLLRLVRVLGHVTLQISLLGVGLSAVVADVGLEVLAVLVLGNVLQQTGLVVEALVAGVAFELQPKTTIFNIVWANFQSRSSKGYACYTGLSC